MVNNKKSKYDLEERTGEFGKNVIIFIKSIKKDEINKSLINQIIRSATSVGANYMEADGAESGRDFKHKIAICKKEAKETKHWFHMIAVATPEKSEECRILWKEAHELTLIFSAILRVKKK